MKLGAKLVAQLDPLGRTSRRTYAQWGVGLAAVKMLLDRAIAFAFGADYWNWLSYWRLGGAQKADTFLLMVLLAVALPFVIVGVCLTLRRLRDAGASRWLVMAFFLPAGNLVMFALLCVLPAHDQAKEEPPYGGILGRLVRLLSPLSRGLSAVVAIFLTVALVVPMTWLATTVFKSYGWGVFLAMPFLLGFLATVIHSAAEPRGFLDSLAVSMLALMICGAMIIAVALEGAICLLMALPLATPLVLLGAIVGHQLQRSWWHRAQTASRLYVAGWLVLPVIFLHEIQFEHPVRVVSATTSMEIAAAPAAVWGQVVAFSELPPPNELVFRAGIAYPMRATLTGHGVGAVRRCEFSTGPFVEPITVWDENRHLAFNVVAQPHPMHELSPYRAIHPPHFDGFFLSQRGEFRLTALPNGGTRLEGTTWYTQRLWPAVYWQVWSDYLLHAIHGRVLAHIRSEAERVAPLPAATTSRASGT